MMTKMPYSGGGYPFVLLSIDVYVLCQSILVGKKTLPTRMTFT